jgi:hypothetical protein
MGKAVAQDLGKQGKWSFVNDFNPSAANYAILKMLVNQKL